MIEAEDARCPLPAAVFLALHHDFFTDGIDALFLFEGIRVFGCEVLVQKHTVFQKLISGDGAQCEVLCLMLYVHSGVQQIAVIAALIVVGRLGYVSGCLIIESVGVTALVAVFITYVEVEFPILTGQVNGTGASTGGLAFIYLLIIKCRITEETSFIVVKPSSGEGEPLVYPVVMGDGSIVLVVRTGSYAEVGALVRERRFGMHFDESAHCISSVQGALGAAQYVDALDVGVVEVECGLIYIRYVVDV